MLTIISLKNSSDFQTCAHTNRIQLFLRYKHCPYNHVEINDYEKSSIQFQYKNKNFPFLISEKNTTPAIFENSLDAMREIEEVFPHPIGFIGPVEPLLQTSSLLLPKTLSHTDTKTILNFFSTLLKDITKKLEYSDFLMGPTFSVADCVLTGDLQALEQCFPITLPPPLVQYCQRVSQKCL